MNNYAKLPPADTTLYMVFLGSEFYTKMTGFELRDFIQDAADTGGNVEIIKWIPKKRALPTGFTTTDDVGFGLVIIATVLIVSLVTFWKLS